MFTPGLKTNKKTPPGVRGDFSHLLKPKRSFFLAVIQGLCCSLGTTWGGGQGGVALPGGSLIPPGALCPSLHLQKHNFKFLIPVHHLWRGKLTSGMLVLLFHSTLSYKKYEYWSGDVFINCFVFFSGALKILFFWHNIYVSFLELPSVCTLGYEQLGNCKYLEYSRP